MKTEGVVIKQRQKTIYLYRRRELDSIALISKSTRLEKRNDHIHVLIGVIEILGKKCLFLRIFKGLEFIACLSQRNVCLEGSTDMRLFWGDK